MNLLFHTLPLKLKNKNLELGPSTPRQLQSPAALPQHSLKFQRQRSHGGGPVGFHRDPRGPAQHNPALQLQMHLPVGQLRPETCGETPGPASPARDLPVLPGMGHWRPGGGEGAVDSTLEAFKEPWAVPTLCLSFGSSVKGDLPQGHPEQG